MRILGIDPGSRRTGYGIIVPKGPRFEAVAYGVLVLGDGGFSHRLRCLYDGLTAVIETHQPTTVAVESIFYARHAASALKLGHARGVALLVASLADLETAEYAPTMVKQAVTSSGKANKAQVQKMVSMLLGLKKQPASDAADALAVAICHAREMRSKRLVSTP